MESKVLISILLCLFVVNLNATSVTISSSSPSGSTVSSRTVISLTGCGFRQFNSAVCTWDFEYYSPIHIILSDSLIYCETPQLSLSDFEVLPIITSLYVIFDGDQTTSVLVNSNYQFGPNFLSFTPELGFVNGGEEFRIIGNGFSDFSEVNVTFDDAQGINATIIGDNQILCTVPPGEFNQNAIISVYFQNNTNYFFHFDSTYHYGPVLYGISPPCGSVTGGTVVTILGTNLDDPFIAYSAAPDGVTPGVEVIYNNGLNRLYALDVQFNPQNNLIVFTTPNIGAVFGSEVQFAVYFKEVYSKVAVTALNDFTYGPIIYNSLNNGNFLNPVQNPSLLSGSLGGGELIKIYGCGLAQFASYQYDILFNTQQLCVAGSTIVNTFGNPVNDYIACVVAPLTCGAGDNTGVVSIALTAGIETIPDPQILPPIDESPLYFQAGPIVDATSISAIRGPRTGNQLVSIQGSNLFYSYSSTLASPGWSVTVNFIDPTPNTTVLIPSVQATFVSNTELSFITPVGLFDLDVEISFDFGTVCTGYPRTSNFPSYHFGPICNLVSPAYGYWSGGSYVTISGAGFEEDNNLLANTDVRLCIQRLSTSGICEYEESPRDSFSLNDTQIILTTPSSRQNVVTLVGDNRLFGDVADVYVHFYQAGGGANIEFPINQLRPGLTDAVIVCPNTYTFSPAVETVTPTYGQVVPRVNPVLEPVVVNGEFFADPNLKNDITVTFSGLLTVNPSITSDNTIATDITWGLTANVDNAVGVIFDNGNQTFSGVTIGFGPAIYSIATEKLGNPIVSAYNPNGDVYGLFPNGNETVIVTGEGFSAYDGSIKCTIGGDDVEYFLDSDTQIRCITPCKPFGAQVTLSLSFGRFCSAYVIDWSNTITANQYLYYIPRIDTFYPVSGNTSGGDTVTISGEGFSAWGKYQCFFGYYSNEQHVFPSADGTTIVCTTPINRAEFNTYTTVQIQLSAFDDDDTVEAGYVQEDQSCSSRGVYVDENFYAGVENHDFKVYAPNKFFFGPVCNDISPSSCPLTGCVAAVVGSGFQDCVTGNQSIYTKTYPYNDCIFRYYRVQFVDPVTQEITFLTAPTNDTLSPSNSNNKLYFYAPTRNCGYEPEIQIEFYSPVVSSASTIIKCTYPQTRAFAFHYGPIINTQTSTYYDITRQTSYGWSGDTVTITGIDFRDPSIFGAVTCNFGDLSAKATSVDTIGSTVVCTVPTVSANYWDTDVSISLTWSGASTTCSPVFAEQFHFGPTIRSITPSRGFVAGATPVTISGFAFGCCGISQYSCLFPPVTPPKVDDTQLYATNTVTCTVPQNQDIDVLINNVGVAFTSPLFGTQNVTFTEDNTSLTYYYGPYVTGYTPSHSTLSGRDQYVVIQGVGFDDPYLIETFCDFFNATSPGFDFVPIPPLEEEYVTPTTITCPVPTFAHYAGAVDSIRPRWRRVVENLRPELRKYYYKTVAPPVNNTNQAPYFSDGGSLVPSFLEGFFYGPVITSVCVGLLCDDSLPRSLVGGGLEITVYFDSLRDFVSNSTTFDFGSQTALCVFGDRLANELTPIITNPDNDNGGYVVCVTPPGDFAFDGELSVILNPNLSPITVSAGQFHTSPYTTGLSRNWVSTSGFETVVVYGSGFCNYATVRCIFSNGISQNDATQGDITNDKMVTCRTPSRAAGYSNLSLQFCSGSDLAVCSCNQVQDYITVPQTITFYGINSVTPNVGSLCGGTTLQYSGYGFSNFNQITCTWQSATVQNAVIINDNLFTCVSIDVSQVFNDDSAHCSPVSVVGIRDNVYYNLPVPNSFESGIPQLISISPSSVDISSLATTVIVVNGLYFNGNGYQILCNFYGFVASPGNLTVDSNGNYFVLCAPPTSINVGTYDFSLTVGCNSVTQFTTNNLHFNVTQTPIVQKVRPIAGPEIGGQTVTIDGFNFNGGSLYVCVFGSIPVGAIYNETLSQLTCKSPAFLETDDDVKIPLYISLDGGETLFRSKDDYIYQNIAVVKDDNVCVKEQVLNDGSHLSVSLFVTIIFVCISLAIF